MPDAVLMSPVAQVAADMKRYKEVTALESDLDKEKKILRDRILSYLREGGTQVDGLEAGGYRASVSYRTYWGFNGETGGGPMVDDGRDHTYYELDPEERKKRLAALKSFFTRYYPDGYIPASDKIAKAVEAAEAASPRFAKAIAAGNGPAWLKKTETPILRVSGSGVA